MSVEVAFQRLDEPLHFADINVILLRVVSCIFWMLLRISQTVPQHPGVLWFHHVGNLQWRLCRKSPDHLEVLDAGLSMAISP